MGRVTSKVLNQAEDFAVWTVSCVTHLLSIFLGKI
jgi:hypothetical protein